MNETLVPRLKFNSDGHVPAVIQDAKSLKVLTLCYMNQAAIEKTVAEGFVYVYRRSLGAASPADRPHESGTHRRDRQGPEARRQ